MDTFSHNLLLLFILAISLPHILPSVNGDSDLIQKTCKTTKYYDLCVSSLKSDSTSPQADTKGLAVIMVRIGITNASSTNLYLSSQISPPKNANSNGEVMKRVLKECADKYSYAGESMKSALQNMEDEAYDYAYMNVMAAADYPNGCRNAFKRYPNLVYPKQLAQRADGFTQICEVVMGIIDALGG